MNRMDDGALVGVESKENNEGDFLFVPEGKWFFMKVILVVSLIVTV